MEYIRVIRIIRVIVPAPEWWTDGLVAICIYQGYHKGYQGYQGDKHVYVCMKGY